MKFVFGPYLTPFEFLQAAAVFCAILLALFAPTAFARLFTCTENTLRAVAARPLLAYVLVAATPLVLRAILLPVYGVPQPGIHDEYAFLLQADTFASGRWTNPTPPLPEYFESIYILVRPTYTAQYQMAPALLLAAAKSLTGTPWLGVFCAMGFACAMLNWLLKAWLPPAWALAGGFIAAFQFGVLSYWMNSYFGGVVPLIGGTIVLGALPRLRGGRQILNASLLAVGLAILMHSRPLEALLLFLISMVAIICWTGFRLRIFAPVALILLASVALMAFYDRKVTGDATELPYSLNQKLYGTPQGFYWQPPLLLEKFPNQQLRDEYLTQLRFHERRNSFRALLAGTFGRIRVFWGFFLTPIFTIPLLFLPRIWRAPGMRIVLAVSILFALEYLTFFAFLPQYAAPITGVILIVLLQCLRQLRATPPGLFLARALPAICVLSVLVSIVGRYSQPFLPDKVTRLLASEFGTELYRARFQKQLLAEGGRHLVIVHYQPGHQVDTEWVYNDADIPNSPVVWARQLDSDSISKLTSAFPGRRVWIGNPDDNPPSLIPYSAH